MSKKTKRARLDQGCLAKQRLRLVYEREPESVAIRANDATPSGSGHVKRGRRVGMQPLGAVIFRIVSGLRPRHN